MSKYSCFEVQINDGIAHLIMNRPDQLNSMTRIFWKELPEIVKDIDQAINKAQEKVKSVA